MGSSWVVLMWGAPGTHVALTKSLDKKQLGEVEFILAYVQRGHPIMAGKAW